MGSRLRLLPTAGVFIEPVICVFSFISPNIIRVVSFTKLILQVGNYGSMTFNILSQMTRRMNSRATIWTWINMCSFRPCITPNMNLFRPPFPHRLSTRPSLCSVLQLCSPFLLRLLLSRPLVSRPSSFYCLYVFFPFSYSNDEGTVGQFFDTGLWQLPSLLEEVLASSYLSLGLTSKLKKVTNDGMNLFSMRIM